MGRVAGGCIQVSENILEQVENPKRIGVASQGKSVRTISDAEFGAITRAGLRETLDPSNAIKLELDPRHLDADALAMVTAPPEDQLHSVHRD